jgi:hypothetical protein
MTARRPERWPQPAGFGTGSLVGGVTALFAFCLLTGCGGNEERADSPPSPNAQIFAQPPTLAPAVPTPALTPVAHEPLPRQVAEVALGMPHAEVEHILGQLECNPRPAGYTVCTGGKGTGDQVSNLEIFLYHDHVLSLSYGAPVPGDAWTYLESFVTTYGEPSLKGLTEHDSNGRLHEIYGWKDDTTIYSVRLIWVEEAPNPRQFAGVAITLWDRAAYLDWEKDPARLEAPPRRAHADQQRTTSGSDSGTNLREGEETGVRSQN